MRPDAEEQLELVVTRREQIADDVVGLVLEHPGGQELPQWSPGAHIDLVLTESLVRQYSLCSSPADRHRWLIGVLREPAGRGGSAYVHEELREGTRVTARGPRNHFALAPAQRYQFIAGGIGITPIIAMIEAAEAGGADWHLLFGGRRRSSMAFAEELAKYAERVTICPQDEDGLLDLDAVLQPVREDTLVYCCGPEGLLTAVEQACAPWPAGALRVERFAPSAVDSAASPDALERFEVVCQRSNLTIDIGPGESILDALRAHGVNMLSSCGEGICGTCETPVLEGRPDHRDSVLADDEKAANDAMMVCVSRSLSARLVLDV
ncbi:PDR/VanB family oxidoreductase [Mycobacterium sp. DL592]|uniref:PDR/VanB family oxidoreductase n=1 Tax=Mycobacterium sp. DL592 TaxID=2675524 RepID=UPI001420C5DD|nr:PDR/VanB family oxidoreductase [Mycobacterium sp. DL592]